MTVRESDIFGRPMISIFLRASGIDQSICRCISILGRWSYRKCHLGLPNITRNPYGMADYLRQQRRLGAVCYRHKEYYPIRSEGRSFPERISQGICIDSKFPKSHVYRPTRISRENLNWIVNPAAFEIIKSILSHYNLHRIRFLTTLLIVATCKRTIITICRLLRSL